MVIRGLRLHVSSVWLFASPYQNIEEAKKKTLKKKEHSNWETEVTALNLKKKKHKWQFIEKLQP